MSGYTPLFASIVTGTLCGKWPDIGLWPVLLSMADWRGEIDATQQYISTVTGLPLPEVTACIERFCEPDPGSRSHEANGARLVLVDPKRTWGWRVVNIQLYRNKASGRDQIEDGRNAEKVRRYKERHRETPGDTKGHAPIASDTNSYSYSDSYSDSDKNQDRRVSRAERSTRLPDDWLFTPDRQRAAEAEKIDGIREFQRFTDHWHSASGASARKLDWDAAWRNWCRKAADYAEARPAKLTRTPKTPEQIEAEAANARE